MPGAHDYLNHKVVARMTRLSEAGSENLSPADRERAARYRFPEDRQRFVLGRELLGKCLRHYRGYPAGPLELAFTPQGRPLLARDPVIQFSISHSRDLVAVALSIETRVGIDVEYLPRRFDFKELAPRIFSTADLEQFRALPETESRDAFFRAWTGKEACLKARGTGLFDGIREISVPFLQTDPTGTPTGDASWRLQALPMPADYMGSVAWDDPAKALDFREMKMSEAP